MIKINNRLKIFTGLLVYLMLCTAFTTVAQKQEFYQLKIYHFEDKDQEAQLDTYLQQAYLPALHRAGISKVGVFKPFSENDKEPSGHSVYVFIPFKSAEQFTNLDQVLAKDKQYTAAGKTYIDAAHDKAPYSRIESMLLQAFAGMPAYKVPSFKSAPSERVYELRHYEAATEKLHQNKIDMFNNGEIKIFEKLGFNAIFYGKVLAGGKLPSLSYMTSFENKAVRDAKWKAFGDDPDWKKLSAMPQYANNFKRADIILMHPMPYSEI